jgi:hypothetical protein
MHTHPWIFTFLFELRKDGREMRNFEEIYTCWTQRILRDATTREFLLLTFQEFIATSPFRRSAVSKELKGYSPSNEDCGLHTEFESGNSKSTDSCLLGKSAVLSAESQLEFRKNMSPQFYSDSACYLLHVGSSLGLFFEPHEHDIFLLNVAWISSNCIALYTRRLDPLKRPLWETHICEVNTCIMLKRIASRLWTFL